MLFWILATLMVLAALAMLLPSLFGWRRGSAVDRASLNMEIFNDRLAQLDQDKADGVMSAEDYAAARHELERELLRDAGGEQPQTGTTGTVTASRGSALVVGLFVPLLTLGLYFSIGERELATNAIQTAGQSGGQSGGQGGRQPSIAEMVDGLASKMEKEPRNLEGWTMLGRSYQMLERYDEALAAFAHARELAPQDPDLLVFHGETLALARGGNLEGEPARFVSRALAIEPNHPNGLWLKGVAARQQGDAGTALASWRRLRGLLEEDERAMLDEHIADLEADRGNETPTSAGAAVTAAEPTPSPATLDEAAEIKVKVSLDSVTAAEARDSDTVFVFARAAAGPRMPLAIVRKTVADLPFEVVLDDDMAMTPAFRLSNFDEVVIGARISRSGNAMPQAGDLQGLSKPVPWRRAPAVDVVIDSRVEG
ncbi:MAG: c-type cytochrome biogenesis protein CcmI [Gammaproteobacteria bacterium]|nr:c-type cytochrome biogenesis protein CcmI [Gammaproteobacteria bacterium]